MKTFICTNSEEKAVTFYNNSHCGNSSYMAFALQYDAHNNNYEHWFTIGSTGYFKTLAGAKRAAVKELARHGYKLNEKELAKFTELPR